MSDLIDRGALVDKTEILYQHTESGKIIPWSAVRVCAINNAPAVDAVEVVRCKDCAKRGDYKKCPMCYQVWNDEEERFPGFYETCDDTYDTFFCENGVKKDAAD